MEEIGRGDRSSPSQEYQPRVTMALPGIATFLQHHSSPRTASSSWGSTDSDGSSNSPSLGAFKSISISYTSSTQRSYLPSTSNSLHTYSSSSSPQTSGIMARTHVNYNLKANPTSSNRIDSSAHRRPVVRTSRYLREVDRRNILRRIEQGDKQADLAKEYQVSRAAISNLKQRRIRNLKDQQPVQLLTQRRSIFGINEGNQVTQHLSSPFLGDSSLGESSYHSESERSVSSQSSSSMKLMLSPMQLGTPMMVETTNPKQYLDRVTQVNTTTVAVLFARILDQRTDARVFEMSKKRIARLLLEHALSLFQTREIEIPVPSLSSHDSNSTSPVSAAPSSYLGIKFQKPTSAVAVSSRREGMATASAAATAGALLQEFRAIEPLSETGSVSFRAPSIAIGNDCMVQLPHTVHESSVLLLVDTLNSSSAQGVAMAIQAIVRAGTQQSDICIVAICSHDRALAQVLEVFTRVRVVTAKVFAANGTAEAPHQLPTVTPVAQLQRRSWP